MRQWRVGTLSMALVLIASGAGLLVAKINNKAVLDIALKWWPLVLVILGLEILLFAFWGRESGAPVKYDLFSILMIAVILFCGLGLVAFEETGIAGKIREEITYHSYQFDTGSSAIAVEPGVKKLVIEAPPCSLKIFTADTKEVRSHETVSVRAENREMAQKLLSEEELITSHASGTTQFISFQPPAAENLYIPVRTLFIPDNLDVEVHNKNSDLQINAGKITGNWKIVGSDDLQVNLPQEADLAIKATTAQENEISGNIPWQITESTREEVGDNPERAVKNAQAKVGKGAKSMEIILTHGDISANQI